MPDPIPAGCEGLIPHLVCDPCSEALEFYKKALGANVLGVMPAPGGQKIIHAAMDVDGLRIFLVDDFPEMCGGQSQSPQSLGGSPVTIHRYVKDVDAVVQKAVDAGATLKMPVSDMFWGDRYGVVVDPYGHSWSFATHIKDLTPEEMTKGMEEAFSQHPG